MTYDDFRSGELQGWDERADGCDTATAWATAQAIPDLLAAVRLAPGLRLLDVCCGPGYAAGARSAPVRDYGGQPFPDHNPSRRLRRSDRRTPRKVHGGEGIAGWRTI